MFCSENLRRKIYPSWLQTETVDKTRFILANDKTTLLYLTNLGCIDQTRG